MATHFGTVAADYLANGIFSKILVWQKDKIEAIDLEEVASQAKSIPLDSPLLQTVSDLGICLGN